MNDKKEIRWIGSSYEDLQGFPREARRTAGFQLGRVQVGLDPEDWKPFDDIGSGTKEIRIEDASGIYRVMYLAKSRKPSMSFIVFKRKHGRPANKTSS